MKRVMTVSERDVTGTGGTEQTWFGSVSWVKLCHLVRGLQWRDNPPDLHESVEISIRSQLIPDDAGGRK
jgi:hypothetical protein